MYHQSRIVEYENFLESNFDRTSNRTSLFVQICMISQANIKTYIIKEILQQPDRDEFMTAMEKELTSLSKEEI